MAPKKLTHPQPQKRQTCHADLQGVNSEGGGGPGQAALNNNGWGLTIHWGSFGASYDKTVSTDTGPFDFAVLAADYGGGRDKSPDLNFRAHWDFGSNSWSMCQLSIEGGKYADGAVSEHVDTGTVSTSYSDCTWDFTCWVIDPQNS
jgi:hypothetical protein